VFHEETQYLTGTPPAMKQIAAQNAVELLRYFVSIWRRRAHIGYFQ
jgi:hypothetical protein